MEIQQPAEMAQHIQKAGQNTVLGQLYEHQLSIKTPSMRAEHSDRNGMLQYKGYKIYIYTYLNTMGQDVDTVTVYDADEFERIALNNGPNTKTVSDLVKEAIEWVDRMEATGLPSSSRGIMMYGTNVTGPNRSAVERWWDEHGMLATGVGD